VLLIVYVVGHVFLSRSSPCWHITAVGSTRKAARHSGIKVERVLFSTYVLSGVLCAMGCAVADIRYDYSQTFEQRLDRTDIDVLHDIQKRQRAEGEAQRPSGLHGAGSLFPGAPGPGWRGRAWYLRSADPL
jgi:hypothetical protein